MKKKLGLSLLSMLLLFSSCVSAPKNLGWSAEDFGVYAAGSGGNTFALDYIVVSLDFLSSQYAEYFDSRIFFDSLPARDIAKVLENEYGVKIDTSYFSSDLKKGRLNVDAQKEKEYKAEELGFGATGLGVVEGEFINDSYLWRQTFRGGKVVYDYDMEHIKIPKAGDYMFILWGGQSGFYKPAGRNWNWTGAYGKMNQMQVLIYVDEPKTVEVTVRLCVPQEKPIEGDFYNMRIAAEHTVTVLNEPFQADAESMKRIADGISRTAELLALEIE